MRARASLLSPILMVVLFAAIAHAQTPAVGAAWDSVSRILKAPASATGGYYRYGLPRRDITLKIGDVTVSPALALGGWAGFSGAAGDATVMGDLVLLASEVKPVLAELARQRLDVTAVHNHLAGEEPQLTYVHFHGQGGATELATRLDRVLARTATPRPVAAPVPAPPTIDTALVFRTLGHSGTARGTVAQAALAAHGIAATAVHTHLIGESPHLYYMHFWADGPLADVLAGLRAALDAAR